MRDFTMQCHVMAAMGVPLFPGFYIVWLFVVITAFGNLLLKFICIAAWVDILSVGNVD